MCRLLDLHPFLWNMFGKYIYHTFTGPTLSTSTSSFEALDPHDPNLSRLATTMFQKTADYLFGELTATQVRIMMYWICRFRNAVLPLYLDHLSSQFYLSPISSLFLQMTTLYDSSIKIVFAYLVCLLVVFRTLQDWVTKCLFAWILNYPGGSVVTSTLYLGRCNLFSSVK